MADELQRRLEAAEARLSTLEELGRQIDPPDPGLLIANRLRDMSRGLDDLEGILYLEYLARVGEVR